MVAVDHLPHKMAASNFPPKQKPRISHQPFNWGRGQCLKRDWAETNGGQPQPGEAQKTRPAHQSPITVEKG